MTNKQKRDLSRRMKAQWEARRKAGFNHLGKKRKVRKQAPQTVEAVLTEAKILAAVRFVQSVQACKLAGMDIEDILMVVRVANEAS